LSRPLPDVGVSNVLPGLLPAVQASLCQLAECLPSASLECAA